MDSVQLQVYVVSVPLGKLQMQKKLHVNPVQLVIIAQETQTKYRALLALFRLHRQAFVARVRRVHFPIQLLLSHALIVQQVHIQIQLEILLVYPVR
jgi:hypothetical protein